MIFLQSFLHIIDSTPRERSTKHIGCHEKVFLPSGVVLSRENYKIAKAYVIFCLFVVLECMTLLFHDWMFIYFLKTIEGSLPSNPLRIEIEILKHAPQNHNTHIIEQQNNNQNSSPGSILLLACIVQTKGNKPIDYFLKGGIFFFVLVIFLTQAFTTNTCWHHCNC